MKKSVFGNLLYIVWFGVYFFITWLVFGATSESLVIVSIIYAISITIAFLPPAESLMRFLSGAKTVRTKKDQEKLIPLFEEAYGYATMKSKWLSSNISLYIVESMDINAFALGRKTIAVTRGAIALMSSEELIGFMAHEFGHIANKDTYVSLILSVGNLLFTVLLSIASLLLRIVDSAFVRSHNFHIMKVVAWIIRKIIQFFYFLGDLILMPVSRSQEYLADKFAYDCGYGEELIKALYKLMQLSQDEKQSILSYIKATHPSLDKRVERLENYTETPLH